VLTSFAKQESCRYWQMQYLTHYKAACGYFCANHALLCATLRRWRTRVAREMSEQLRRTPLIAICLLVNESDVPLHSTRQRNIGVWLFVVVRERTSIR